MLFKFILPILICFVAQSLSFAANRNNKEVSGWENAFSYNNTNVLPLKHYGNKSYYLGVHIGASYLQAVQFCNNIHMNLLTIENEEENKQIYKFIRDLTKPQGFWTSGSRILDGQNWIWMSYGQHIKYTNWGPNEPDTSNEHCLQIGPRDGSLYWNDADCTNIYYLICERHNPRTYKENLVKQTSRWDKILTNTDILRHGNKRYYFSTTVTATYMLALEFCKIINMQLVSITSQEENDKLSQHIRSIHPGSRWWSSGSKLIDGKNWVWLNKAKSIDYTNWHDLEPSGDGEFCLMLIHDNNKGLKWADEYCSTQSNFICESFDDDDYDPFDPNYGRNTGKNWKPTYEIIDNVNPSPSEEPEGVDPTIDVESVELDLEELELKPTSKKSDEEWEEFLRDPSMGPFVTRYYTGKKYLLQTKIGATQNQARRFCEYKNMQLLEITDETENEKLKWILLDTGSSGPFWLGGRKKSGEWYWPISQRSVTYENWATHRPTRRSNKQCMVADHLGRWNEQDCDRLAYFICYAKLLPDTNIVSPTAGQCSEPIVNVYINTNLVTEKATKSLSKQVQSSKNLNKSNEGYQVQVNNNIDLTKENSSTCANTNNNNNNNPFDKYNFEELEGVL